MTTPPVYRACIVCDREIGVEIAVDATRGPAGVDVVVMPERSNIVDINCAHAPDVLLWLSTIEGAVWCEAQVEACRLEGSLA